MIVILSLMNFYIIIKHGHMKFSTLFPTFLYLVLILLVVIGTLFLLRDISWRESLQIGGVSI